MILIIGLFLAGCSFSASTQTNSDDYGPLPQNAVARVNNKVITKENLDQKIDDIKRQYGQQGGVPQAGTPEYADFQKQVAEELVNEEVMWFEADKRGITVSEDDVNKKIDQIKQSAGGDQQFQKELDQSNITLDHLKDNVSKGLIYQKLLADVTKDQPQTTDTQSQDQRQAAFMKWLDNVKKNYTITYADQYNPTITTQKQTATQQSTAQIQTQQQISSPEQPTVRNVTGTATTLGAGTFTGGKDVPEGLYDVTAPAGGYGNFMVSGQDYSNDILGANEFGSGVSKIRVIISDGDKITISGVSEVAFTPVTAPLAPSSPTITNLYAGTFVVGPDIPAGRYVATAPAGGSGNFMVEGTDTYNGILGGDYGTPNITVTLTDGDKITISGLDQVTMAPTS